MDWDRIKCPSHSPHPERSCLSQGREISQPGMTVPMVAMNEVYLINLKVAFVSISAENDEVSI